ncbi:MAG: 1-deoxy-D-xylulose-5-phosphate synthase [Clostridia bacterium]|nr:1-deoxy-D-xylulose-5-phosphate synthase [Clostridia bacterium]
MQKEKLLGKIKLPEDIKKLSCDEIDVLCKEIREKIIKTVAKNGGHLASNLGVVELTVAIHRIFNRPKDKVIWDVGHQCYTDKILTGRLCQFDTIRTENGISGFPKTAESEYDGFNVGHSSTSISAALGISESKKLRNEEGKVIAVIGDGSLSGGLAYEGLNNAGKKNKNLIVILNDNNMSISKNVGSMARYLARIRTKKYYIKARNAFGKIIEKVPIVGKLISRAWNKFKTLLKDLMYDSTMFEYMGFTYYGPIDGHNMKDLCRVLEIAKDFDKPVLIHTVTVKGKGYKFAEEKPGDFHGVSAFDVNTGKGKSSGSNFSKVFGEVICELAKDNDKICAITAAMTDGTGLTDFSKMYRERFFDVGIAEAHAVTFAGALSLNGLKPVVAVYSSFLQRAYDQLIHDVAIQESKVVLAIDRAGVVGEDGETHQGLFDVSMLNSIPNSVIYSPSFFEEIRRDLISCLSSNANLSAVRYPRGAELYKPEYYVNTNNPYDTYFESDIAVVTYGRIFSNVCLAREQLLKDNINIKIIKLNRIKPVSNGVVKEVLGCKKVFFFEESVLNGGIAQSFGIELVRKNFEGEYKPIAVENKFVSQASVESSLISIGLDAQSIKQTIYEFVNI